MRQHLVFAVGYGLASALAISACGVAAVHADRPRPDVSGIPVTPEEAAVSPAATSPCATVSAFALSLVSDRGGQPTPVKAAYWFARHGGVPAIPDTGWRQVSRSGTTATVKSGAVTLHVIEGPDRTWQVDGGEWCG